MIASTRSTGRIWHSAPLQLEDEAFTSWIDDLTQIHSRGSYKVQGGPQDSAIVQNVHATLGIDRGATWTTRSGLEALEVGLRAAGARQGSLVAAPSFSYRAVGDAIHATGATPLWCDVADTDWNLGPNELRRAVGGSQPPAIVLVVDNFGTPASLPALRSACDEFGSRLVLDACESLGAKRAGWDLCDAIALSFSFSKPIHAFGSGGALCLPGDRLRLTARDAGSMPQRVLPSANAAFLLRAWPHLPAAVERLRRNHRRYVDALGDLITSTQAEIAGHSTRLHVPVGFANHAVRERVRLGLREADIETKVQFPLQRDGAARCGTDLPISEGLIDRVLSLPTGPALDEEQLDLVIDIVRRSAGRA